MSEVTARDRLIVALDQPQQDAAWNFVQQLGDAVSFYKVGWVSLLNGGVGLVESLLEAQKSVFLDLKIFDVPQTVELAIHRVSQLGAKFATVHGNQANISAALTGRGAADLKILAVTVLTSLNEEDVRELYSLPDQVSIETHVVNVARNLVSMGCDGVIASPHEIAAIRKLLPDHPLIVAPGIRMPGEDVHDQKRTGDPYESIRKGADYLVVGRSIYCDDDPAAKVEEYVAKIEKGLADR